MPDSNNIQVVISGENQTGSLFSQVGSALDGLVEKMGGLSGLLEGLTLVEVVRRFAEFAEQTLEAEIGLTRMAESTGIAIEQLGGLTLAAQMSGVSTEEFEGSVKKFAGTLSAAAAGNMLAKQTLDSLGISAKDANGNVVGISDALAKVADKFAATKDGTDKAALAVQLFGRRGLDLIPVLDKGSAGLDEMNAKAAQLHLTLTAADQEAIKQFDDDLGLLKAAGVGLTEQFLRGLVPALDAVVKSMNDTVGGFDAMQVTGEALGGVLKVIATVIETLGATFAWASEQALAFFGVIQSAGQDLDTRLKTIWTDIWDPAVAAQGAQKQLDNITRVAQNAEAIWKAALQQKMDTEKLADNFAQSISQLAQQRNDELYKANLITVQQYFDSKRKLQQDDLAFELISDQTRKQILQNAINTAPNEQEKINVQRQLNDLLEQETVLQAQLNAAKGVDAEGNPDMLVQQAQAMEVFGAEAAKLGGQITDILGQVDEATQQVQTDENNYQLSVIQGDQKISAIRDKAREQLQGMVQDYKDLAQASGDPKLIQNADKFGKELASLGSQVDSLRKEEIQAGTQDFQGFFEAIFQGGPNAASAFTNFAKSLLQSMDQIIAKMLAVWAMQKVLGLFGGLFGGGGAATSTIGDAGSLAPAGIDFGSGISAAAGGGSFSSGDWSWVGEQGPELVHFGANATVIPHSASVAMAGEGGGNTVNIDARGAQAGVSQEIANAIRISEERSVARAKIEFREMQRRRP